MEFCENEKKIKFECGRKFFDEDNRRINPDNVKYDVVSSFGKLMEIAGIGMVSSDGEACR